MAEEPKEKDELLTLATEMKKFDTLKKELTYTLKGTVDRIEALSERMLEILDERQIKLVKFEGLGTFFIKGDAFPKIENEEALFKWLKDNGHGAIIKTGVAAQTLRAFCNSLQSEGQALPEGVTPGHMIRKVKVRAK